VLHGRGELDAHADLYHAPGLLSYILVCAQAPHGGMRDKPGKVTSAIRPQLLISKSYQLTTPRPLHDIAMHNIVWCMA